MPSRSSELTADPLSAVLQDLRLSGVGYGRCELGRPWGIEFPPQSEARFHFVVSGSCWLRNPDGDWLALGRGDLALLPRGRGHALSDRPRGRTKSIDDLPLEAIGDRAYRLSAGGSGARTLLVCCSVSFDEPALHPLLELMPNLLLVRGADADASLPLLLETMAAELAQQRIGSATVMTRLADVIITRIVRAWVEENGSDSRGWLAAIRDPKIGRALAAIHRRPGEAWSVEALAGLARTSRSIFSQRFSELVGTSPARYLTRLRMHLASGWLRDERISVIEAATRLGYDSEASFSRAFKRALGVPPSTLRRAHALDKPSR